MSRFPFALLAAVAILAVGGVEAADLPAPNNYNHVEYKRYGNNYSWNPLNGATPSSGSVSFPPRTTISTVEPKITTQVRLPFDTRANVPASQMANIATAVSRANFARAVVSAGRLATPVGAVMTAVELAKFLNDAGIFNVRNTPNGLVGSIEGASDGGGGEDLPLGVEWKFVGWTGETDWSRPSPACRASASLKSKEYPAGYSITGASPLPASLPGGGNDSAYCEGTLIGPDGSSLGITQWNMAKRNIPCPAGTSNSPTGCKPDTPGGQKQDINEQQILEKISIPSVWDETAASALQKAISVGAPVQTESPTVTGPSSIPGDKTTSNESVSLNPGTNTPAAPGATNTQPGTKTTTKEKKTDVKYSGNSASTTTTTNTTTNITNNITNVTTTETSTETTEDQKEDEAPPTDTPLGDIPELYKKKYPDGIAGVVTVKMAELRSTPLFRLPLILMPPMPSSGTCPAWQIDLRFASWADMGTHTIQAPCMVWDFGKVVILVSALLLARRLIFGG